MVDSQRRFQELEPKGRMNRASYAAPAEQIAAIKLGLSAQQALIQPIIGDATKHLRRFGGKFSDLSKAVTPVGHDAHIGAVLAANSGSNRYNVTIKQYNGSEE